MKANKNNDNIKKTKKFCNSLKLISPFSFDNNNSFIYNIKIYENFIKFCKSLNDFKPNDEEILFLKTNIENIKNTFNFIDNKYNNTEICEYFKKIYPYITQIKEEFNKEIYCIKNIMENRLKGQNITITKIKEILSNKYNIKLSNSTIYRIIKNKLKYKFRRTVIKNIDLEKPEYKFMSFLFIKIIIRAMMQNFNFIFIDESNFLLCNNHYKTWVRQNENLHYGPKKKNKINLILAVSIHKVVNYELTTKNINKNNFELFMKKTIESLNKEEINNTIWIMDNLSVHLAKNIKDLFKNNKLKVLYTVPYESVFNPIELGFRFIKNITYKKIYLNIKNLKKDVKSILKGDKIKQCLFKNFVETIEKYLQFIESNININLDEKIKIHK